MLAFGLITADGKVRQVTESQHAELFWALKGCGHGQFGVVTDITFKLHDAPKILMAEYSSGRYVTHDLFLGNIAKQCSVITDRFFYMHISRDLRTIKHEFR